jgi:1-acyl-sn-glycerol-3-phosphate acyltransferase
MIKAILKFFGWNIVGDVPEPKKYIAVCAPHTSNWDFILFLCVRAYFRIKFHWIGKHTIFMWPFGWLFKKLGGIPVNRSKANNLVDQVVEQFNSHDEFMLAIAPSGTRKYVDHWKSGFYRMALAAKVPHRSLLCRLQ